MINEKIRKLDNYIGEFNTPFSKYLLYSYNLSLTECEGIIDNIKDNINDNDITDSNIVTIIDDYFKKKVIDLEKTQKIEYLNNLINGDFFDKYLKKYELDDDEINVIYDRIKTKILEENITDFEINRYLKYYFLNSVKQVSYLKELNFIKGRNYDTLIIKKAKKKYPILIHTDIVEIITNIKNMIIEAYDFKKSIKNEFLSECMNKSEAKKAKARLNLDKYVSGSGDSIYKLMEIKNLTKKEGNMLISEIKADINEGLIQPDDVDGLFLTKRFNEYVENERN